VLSRTPLCPNPWSMMFVVENGDVLICFQRVPDGYYLTFSQTKLPINEWWRRAADFAPIVAMDPVPKVTLDFKDWMNL
jgi:hypothetical protein